MEIRKETVSRQGMSIDVYSMNTLIVGSGVAGLHAAERLHALGQTDIALLTEGMGMGTSRNAGSDKQTYYKLTLAGLETARGRRVFLDFTHNPGTISSMGTGSSMEIAGLSGRHQAMDQDELDFSLLGPEAHDYLERSGLFHPETIGFNGLAGISEWFPIQSWMNGV